METSGTGAASLQSIGGGNERAVYGATSGHVLEKTLMELTKTMAGGTVYGELSARSTKLRVPWRSASNDVMDILKFIVQAAPQNDQQQHEEHGPTATALTVEQDIRHRPADLLQELRRDPEPRLVQRRLDHHELLRIKERLVEDAQVQAATSTTKSSSLSR